ncbi:MAG: hypothetical protein GWO04_10110, partial [Actinobacteria bacterium]|nr:hypothetical protein [Actinomycetota bacterium]
LERVPRGRRRLLTPDLVDEAVCGDGLACKGDEHGEDRLLTRSAKGDVSVTVDDGDRSENPDLH